ncbi:MAG: hypothetical protein FWG90_07540 [Oscillospiraceae bacterium]|nr:hypothetical protein [Oscillospiraceae bacterium]
MVKKKIFGVSVVLFKKIIIALFILAALLCALIFIKNIIGGYPHYVLGKEKVVYQNINEVTIESLEPFMSEEELFKHNKQNQAERLNKYKK